MKVRALAGEIAAGVRARAVAWGPEATPGHIWQLNLLVALVAPALMLATISVMADKQNDSALLAEQARAQGVRFDLAQRLGLVAAHILAVEQVPNHRLINAAETFARSRSALGEFDALFILDARGRTLAASQPDIRAADRLGDQLGVLIGAAGRAHAPGRAVGFIGDGHGVAVASMTRVGAGAPARYLLLVRSLDVQTLDRLGRAAGLRKLRLVSPADTRLASVPLRDVVGRPVARLAWQLDAPGYASALAVLPIAGLMFGLLAYAGCVGAGTLQRRVAELVASRRAALHFASRDALLDLPNRRGLALRLNEILGTGAPVALVYLDIDGFKDVNDAFGHGVGDALLVQGARRIEEASGIEPARLGGDEFGLLVEGAALAEQSRLIAQALVDAFAAPIEAAGYQVYVGASIGVAVAEPGIDADELVRRADVAMYAAKHAGKRRWRLYDAGLEEGRSVRRLVAAELRAALAAGAVEVEFQPIVAAGSGHTVAAEALARWTSPTLGAIEPDLFVSVAEENGLIPELTRQVLRQACAAAANWPISVAVNLSAAEMWDSAFADTLLAILDETGMEPARLELEITESHLIRDPAETARTLSMLRALGVRVALDDFGTGFASLSQLARLPLDRVKLTLEFLQQTAGGAAHEAAVAIVALAGALGLPVTAEGIETEAQAAQFRAAGCTRLQGWLYGRAMSAATLDAYLADQCTAAG